MIFKVEPSGQVVIPVLNTAVTEHIFLHYYVDIPAGVKISPIRKMKEQVVCKIDDLDWADIFYPCIKETIKNYLTYNLVTIPTEYMSQAIRVQFSFSDSSNGYDVFSHAKGYFYSRTDKGKSTLWTTVTDIFEPDVPLQENLLIQILNSKNQLLLFETHTEKEGTFQAEKQFPFSWQTDEPEIIKTIYGTENTN